MNSRKARCTPYCLEKRADSQDSIEEWDNFPQTPQEETSLSNRYVRGTLSLLPQVQWIPRCPDIKEGRISLMWLNAGSSFISEDEGMSDSPVETLEKTLVPCLIWTGNLTSLDTSRGPWISMLQKVTRPDSSGKLIGIPLSLWKLERDTWSPTSPPEASVLSCQA